MRPIVARPRTVRSARSATREHASRGASTAIDALQEHAVLTISVKRRLAVTTALTVTLVRSVISAQASVSLAIVVATQTVQQARAAFETNVFAEVTVRPQMSVLSANSVSTIRAQ